MSRGRVYTIGFNGVSVSAVQDLFSIQATGSRAFEVHAVKLGQRGQTTVSGLGLRLRSMGATFVVGSGGTALTPVPVLPGDAGAAVIARANDTTQASSTGLIRDLPDTWDLPFGYLWVPPEADRPVIAPSGAFVVSLDTAPGGTLTVSGHMAIAELW